MPRHWQAAPLVHLHARIERWILARVPRSSGPVTIDRRRVYILPTRFAYLFALLLLGLLLGAMNYSNSMAFALCFLLAGLVLVTMHHTHANLVNLRLRALGTAPVFAGDEAQLRIRLDNPTRSTRYALSLGWRRSDAPASTRTDLPAESEATVQLALPATRRGRLRAGTFRVSSEFPLGLFRAWTWIEFDAEFVVFPQPAPPGRRLPPAYGHGGRETATSAGHDEFSGLRPYQRGDSAHAIHWKSLPRTQQAMVKQFADTVDEESWLDWEQLAPLDTEARLSQLTRWVLELEALHRRYGLQLPGTRIAPGLGDAHRLQCLKALALFGLHGE